MKIHVYKVLWWDRNEEPSDFCQGFEETRIMTEDQLREEWKNLIHEEHAVPAGEFIDYIKDNDYIKEDWEDLDNLSIGTIIDIMNDMINYDTKQAYYILEDDIEIKI